jgi:beta-mannosidase
LEVGSTRVSEETVFLTPPRFLLLPKAKTKADVKLTSPHIAVVTFTSSHFQHRFAFELAGVAHRSSDNFFELYPNEPKTVNLVLARKVSVAQLKRALSFRSLVDTYE